MPAKRTEPSTLRSSKASSLKPSDPIGFLAHQRLAAWQEDRGDLDGAVATLKGLRAAKGFYVPHAMFDIARVEMARGNTEEAKTYLKHSSGSTRTSL